VVVPCYGWLSWVNPRVGEVGVGGAEEARTPDPLLAKEVLSQLSYGPSGVEPSMPWPFGRAKWLSGRAKMVGGPFWTRTRDLSLIRTAL
jgi:hypothetical protein